MEKPEEMTTLSSMMTKLDNWGYKADFILNENGKLCPQGSDSKEYNPQDLLINKVYRFEGESDPADMSVLYSITASDGTKGKLVDAYGTYNSRQLSEFLKEVPMAEDAQI